MEIKKHIDKGEYISALEHLDELAARERTTGLILKSRILEKKGKVTESLFLINEVLRESSELTDSQKLGALISKGYVLANLGKLDELAKLIQEGEELFQRLDREDNDQQKQYTMGHEGSIEYLKARYYFEKGDLQSSQKYYQKSLSMRKSLGNELLVGETLSGIGWLKIHTGDYKVALKNFQDCLTISQKFGNKYEIARSFNSLGLYYANTGDLDSSLKYFEESLVLSEELDYRTLMVTSYINASAVYRKREDHNLALDLLQKAFVISKKTGNVAKTAFIHSLISSVYLAKSHLDFSLEYAKTSLTLWKKIGRTILSAAELQWTAYIHAGKDEYRLAIEKSQEAILKTKLMDKNLLQLQELIQQKRKKLTELNTRFAGDMVLKKSKRGLMKLQTQHFRQIVSEEDIQLEIAVLATLNLCELYILEINIVEDPRELIKEILKLSKELYEMGKIQESPRVIVLAYLIQAKLAQVEFRLDDTFEILDKAHAQAEFHGLHDLLNKIVTEQRKIKNEINKWNELIEKNAAYQARIDQANLEEWLKEAKKIKEIHFSPYTFSY